MPSRHGMLPANSHVIIEASTMANKIPSRAWTNMVVASCRQTQTRSRGEGRRIAKFFESCNSLVRVGARWLPGAVKKGPLFWSC